MNKFIIVAIAGVLALIGCSTSPAPRSNPTSTAKAEVEIKIDKITKANNAFAFDLYERVSNAEGNVFISPASITTALGLAYAGARTETAREMETVLHFKPNEYAVHASLGKLLDVVQIDEPGRTVSINNAIWVDHKTVVESAYSSLIEENYGAREKRVDFRTSNASRENARLEINKWVEDKSKDRIKDLLLPPDIVPDTRMTLVNTIYLKADWALQFTKEATMDNPFSLINGIQVDIPVMRQTSPYRHMKGTGFQAIEMPYVNEEYSMVVALPDENTNFKKFENRLSERSIANWNKKLRQSEPVEVSLRLPKTKLTQRFVLSETLIAMGMPTAFSDFADFNDMVDKQKQPPEDTLGLKIGAVIHKTFLEMDEKGTEAAAASAVTMVVVSSGRASPPPIEFHVNRPYFLMLRHNETGAIVFMGRIVDPR